VEGGGREKQGGARDRAGFGLGAAAAAFGSLRARLRAHGGIGSFEAPSEGS